MPAVKENGMPRCEVCPHCGEEIEVNFSVSLTSVTKRRNFNWTDGLSEEQVALIESARAAGILESFKTVVEHVKTEDRPRSTDRFFANFVKMSTQKLVPSFVIEHFSRVFKGEQLTFWATQGIMAVCANGAIRCFVPQDLVIGHRLKKANGNGNGMKINADPAKLEEWTRTRFGYVAGPGAMMEALKARSFGEFARPGL